MRPVGQRKVYPSALLQACPGAPGDPAGEIFWAGGSLSGLSDRAQSASIGYVGQSPENQMVTDRVWQELAFGPENLGWDPAVIRRRVAEMASFFGIQTWFHREISTLSGGQRQLLALAAVMVLEPALLLLDEPTSQLDPIAAGDFLEMVQRINRELGTTILLAEHRLAEAVPRSDRLLVLEGGQLLCQGTPREVGAWLRRQNHPLAAALPAPMEIWARVSQSGPCPVTVGEGQIWLAEYARSHLWVTCPGVSVPGETLLQAESLWFRYDRNGLMWSDFSCRWTGNCWPFWEGMNGKPRCCTCWLAPGPQRGAEAGAGGDAAPEPPDPLWKKPPGTCWTRQRMDLPPAEGPQRWRRSRHCAAWRAADRHPYDLSGESSSGPPWQRSC
ncbi:MAG: energy-coupling factor ABC transporter ATP-binding protein [Evtepia gabavorous]